MLRKEYKLWRMARHDSQICCLALAIAVLKNFVCPNSSAMDVGDDGGSTGRKNAIPNREQGMYPT